MLDNTKIETAIQDAVMPKFRRLPKATETFGQELLNDRNSTHGNFEDNARISQLLKEMFRGVEGWKGLTYVEREAMDMIALKFSRILSGKSLEKQHWEDVVGYAQLALNQCQTHGE